MHRDEVKIFRGNVETHLRRLEHAAQFSGPPPAATVFDRSGSPRTESDALDYESRQKHGFTWSSAFNPYVFSCLAATAAFLFVLELCRGSDASAPRLALFGGGGGAFLVLTGTLGLRRRFLSRRRRRFRSGLKWDAPR